jgi:cytochrome c-type biogenesis protein CcmE
MSHLDDELAQAVRESEAVAEAQPAPVAVPVGAPRKPKRSVGLLVALLVAGVAILTLALTSSGAFVYARTVDDLLAQKEKLTGRNVTLQGMLKRGTLAKRDDPCEFRFTVKGAKQEVPVRYPACVLPDTFKDVPGMPTEVTAVGSLDRSGYFAATSIVAKCPSKYEMKDRASKGQKAPHDMTGPTSAL